MKFIFILIPSLLADICATDLSDAEFKETVMIPPHMFWQDLRVRYNTEDFSVQRSQIGFC